MSRKSKRNAAANLIGYSGQLAGTGTTPHLYTHDGNR